MMYSDQELHARLIQLRKYEREATVELIDHLQEVYDRRMFADYGHSSVVKYLVKELGYSESAAFRRFQALKLTRDIPESRAMLERGELNITSASLIQGGLKNLEEKKNVLDKSRNQTTQETQNLILEINPELKKKDIMSPLDTKEVRAHITLKRETIEKLEKLKALLKVQSNDEVIGRALDIALEKSDFTRSRTNKVKRVARSKMPRSTAKRVFSRAKNRCEYPGCDEIRNLEIDHILPKAKGGSDNFENLRVLCKAHNQRAAIKEFGLETMRNYLN